VSPHGEEEAAGQTRRRRNPLARKAKSHSSERPFIIIRMSGEEGIKLSAWRTP
jgi:hypothetical protein